LLLAAVVSSVDAFDIAAMAISLSSFEGHLRTQEGELKNVETDFSFGLA
jgi:hypothetical protein